MARSALGSVLAAVILTLVTPARAQTVELEPNAWRKWGQAAGTLRVQPAGEGKRPTLLWQFFRAADIGPSGIINESVRIPEDDSRPGDWTLSFDVSAAADLQAPLFVMLLESDGSTWRVGRSDFDVSATTRRYRFNLRQFYYAWGNEARRHTAPNLTTLNRMSIMMPAGLGGTVTLSSVRFERMGNAPTCPAAYPLDFSKPPLNRYGKAAALPALTQSPPTEMERPAHMLEGKPSRVTFTDGITYVNGKPFFPLGAYNVPRHSFGEMRRAGFNTVHQYRGFHNGLTGVREYLDHCLANGLFGIVDIETYTQIPTNHKLDADGLRKFVDAVRDHPALLAYYAADEPEYHAMPVSEYVKGYRLLKALDPHHPVIIVNQQAESIAAYAKAADVLMPDPYPGFYQASLTQKPLSIISAAASEALLHKPAATWLVPQLHNVGPFYDARGELYGRTPNLTELRFMSYAGLASGARGLVYYTHGAAPWDIRATPRFFEGFKALAQEVRAMGKVAVCGKAIAHDADMPAIRSQAWLSGRQLYLLAVNNSSASVQTEFRLVRAQSTTLTVVSEDRAVNIDADGHFTDTFAPWAVHIYTTDKALASKSLSKLLRADDEVLCIGGTLSPTRERNAAHYLNGAVASASSTLRWPRVSAVNNGSYGAFWLTHGQGPHWLAVTLARATAIGRVVVTAECSDAGLSPLDSASGYELQVRTDATEWQKLAGDRSEGYVVWNERQNRWEQSAIHHLGSAKAFVHTFSKRTISALRLVILSDTAPKVFEIEAYED